MSDKVLSKLASLAHVRTLEDIQQFIPDWPWAEDYGEEVLAHLRTCDNDWTRQKEREREEKMAKRLKESRERKENRNRQVARNRKERLHKTEIKRWEKEQKEMEKAGIPLEQFSQFSVVSMNQNTSL